MTVVQHQLSQPRNGATINGAAVTVRLVGNGFTASGHTEIMQETTVHTKAGLWSLDLVPQSQIDPVGTYYQVTHPDGEVLSFIVSDAAGPLWLRNLLVENPAQPSPVYAGVKLVQNGAVSAAGSTGGWSFA